MSGSERRRASDRQGAARLGVSGAEPPGKQDVSGSERRRASDRQGANLLLVGRITKAHGLRGEVVVDLLSSEPEVRLAPGALLDSNLGLLTVRASRPHQGKWLVTLDGVVSREDADALRGTELRGEPLVDPAALWVHDLVGAEVIDMAGARYGRVAAVLANPAADLLELDGGALVPVTFVVGWDGEAKDRRLVIDPPEGLMDL